MFRFCLQQGAWRRTDESHVTFTGWDRGYTFPNFSVYEIGKEGSMNTQSNSTVLLTPTASNNGGLCSAAVTAPDLSVLRFFPVDCDANFTSRYVCVPRRFNNASDKHNSNSTRFALVGYSLLQNNNSSILHLSTHVCPSGYNILHENTCLKLEFVPTVNDFLCKGMAGNESYFTNLKCRVKSDLIFKDLRFLNSLCRRSDNTSTLYWAVGPISKDGSLNRYLSQVLPPSAVALHVARGKLKLHNDEKCVNKPICVLYPQHKQLYSVHSTYAHFILCSRRPLVTPLLKMPPDFMSYTCADGSLIAIMLTCDGVLNCPQAEDEDSCLDVCTSEFKNCLSQCIHPGCTCSDHYFQCASGGCITFDKFCDGRKDCSEGEDEVGCSVTREFKYEVSTQLQMVDQITGFCSGRADQLPCRSQTQCYSLQSLCQYDTIDGIITHCTDGTHLGSHCMFHVCNLQYKCIESYCIPTRKLCDGMVDCPSGEDEENCDTLSCPGHLRCSQSAFCVPPHEVCDGKRHCPRGDDENFCLLCPKGCHCIGSSVTCVNIENFNSSMVPMVLHLENSYPVFEWLYNRTLLRRTLKMWLNQGEFYKLLETDPLLLSSCESLRWLRLNYQGISQLQTHLIHGPLIKMLDVSLNNISYLPIESFSQLKAVELLNLTSNKIGYLQRDFCAYLTTLKFLYLTDNPLTIIAANLLVNSPNLGVVHSDWYMLCCVLIDVAECQPRSELVSSCHSLFAFLPAKVFVSVQAALALLTNGAVLVRFAIERWSKPDVPLMLSLVSADGMMGMYLLIMAITDFSTSGTFHLYIAQWTRSPVCLTAFILNFVSTEVSILTLTTLSVFRAIALQQIGGLKMQRTRILYSSFFVWGCVFTELALYLAAQGIGDFHVQNNMCIMLGISHHRNVSFHEHVFQVVFISINALLLVSMCASAVNIIVTVKQSERTIESATRSSAHSTQNRTRKLGMKLLLLLTLNMLCWIPILSVAGLFLLGVNVHEDVLIWMTIFIIPICSTTDPFLYNSQVFHFRREKTKRTSV